MVEDRDGMVVATKRRVTTPIMDGGRGGFRKGYGEYLNSASTSRGVYTISLVLSLIYLAAAGLYRPRSFYITFSLQQYTASPYPPPLSP